MRLLYASETVGVVAKDEVRDESPCDWRDVVSRAVSVRTARDFVGFVLACPAALFTDNARDIATLGYISPGHLTETDDTNILRGSIVDAVDRHFPDVEALDMATVRSGALGPYHAEGNPLGIPPAPSGVEYSTEFVSPPAEGLLQVPLVPYKKLCANARTLAAYAAVACGADGSGEIRRLDLGLPDAYHAIDSRLWVTDGSHDACPADCEKPLHAVSRDDLPAVRTAMRNMGFGPTAVHTQDTRDVTEHPFSPVFVYPTSWSDAEMAADLFVALTSIALGECARDDERPFETWHDESGFHVRDHVNPIHAFYREVARLAEAGAFRLCVHCGWPFLADRSRGNGGMYCSGSCNTKASAARRELAYALAAAGTPIDEAVDRIGKAYRRSIERWYEESKALLG